MQHGFGSFSVPDPNFEVTMRRFEVAMFAVKLLKEIEVDHKRQQLDLDARLHSRYRLDRVILLPTELLGGKIFGQLLDLSDRAKQDLKSKKVQK